MSKLVNIESNAEALAAGLTRLGERISGADSKLAGEAFKDVRDLLMENVRSNWTAGNFAPLSPVTVEYKRRKGLDSRTLFASGSSFAGIDGRYGTSWAKAMRGQAEWWTFLHDKGRGYGPWSQEGRGKGTSKRRHRAGNEPAAGVTKFPARPVFFITDSTRGAVLDRVELFLQTACDEVGNASA